MGSRARRGLGRTGGRTRCDDPREMLDFALPAAFRAHAERGRDEEALRVVEEMHRRRLLAGEEDRVRPWLFAKARRLAEEGSFAECEAVVRKAFAIGLGSAALADLAFLSALARGDLDAARSWASDRDLAGGDFDDEVRRAFAADLAVLDAAPEEALDPASAAEARRVAAAFAFHEAGRDEEARRELEGIGRRSPFARWRLVILGLAAREAGDRERARACWERVRGFGVAASFARALLARLGDDRARAAPPFPWCGAEDPRVALLEGVRRELEGGAAKDALLAAVRRLVALWPGGASQEVLERLHRAIVGWGKLPEETIRELPLALGPLPEDPRGLKALALAAERRDPLQAHVFWRKYAERFDDVTGLGSSERDAALAVVWERMGDLARSQMVDPGEARCECPACRNRRRLVDACTPDAAECYEESVRLDPDSLPVWKKWVEALSAAGKRSRAEKVAREISKRWPSDVETLLRLGEQAVERGAYLKAARLFERARSLEPFHRAILARLADAVVSGAWKRARSGNVVAARRDVDRAVRLVGEQEFGPRYSVVAAIEVLSGDAAAGEVALSRAVSSGSWEPSVLLDIAGRLEEAGADAGFASRADEALKALPVDVPNAERAFELFCRTCSRPKARSQVAASAKRRLASYLKRAATLPDFPEETRLRICHGLREVGESKLLLAFAEVGRKRFPEDYRFAILEAFARLGTGDCVLPSGLARALDRAQGAARKRGDHEALWELARIEEARSFLSFERSLGPLREIFEIVAAGSGDGEDELEALEEFLFGDEDGEEDGAPSGRRGR